MRAQQKRKPRYRRAPSNSLRLQERDKEIIHQVYRHRFLNSRQIDSLVEGSSQRILRRLGGLFHENYLTRPVEQIRPYRTGSEPMIYGIGNRGAEVLKDEFAIPRSKIDWTRKNREVGQIYLAHQMMISNFMVCLELACRVRNDVEFLSGDKLDENPAFKQMNGSPGKWKVEVDGEGQGGWKIKLSVIPDKVFGLYFPKKAPSRRRALFFLEADRSTMPVARSNLYRSSFYKKLVGYWESYRQDLFKEYFGLKGARVLTVTKSQQRIDNMIEANKKMDERGKGMRMFLFATRDDITIEDPDRILKGIWKDGRGENSASLLD
jgi:hypothetical protein